MKIFSNFDTEWKQEAYQEAVDKFGKENVFILNKSFLFFFSKVIVPFFGWTIMFILVQFPIYLGLEDFGNIKYIVTGVLFIIYLFVIAPLFKYYLDYVMDFSLVTPEYLTRYNQTGPLKRDIKSSYVKNIKTITIQKNTFWYNIFDNGNLIFLSEGDRDNQGEIVLHYIKDPEAKKKIITKIMKLY
ncbi:hypothetical protein BSK20_05120 [SR1 bacterium human oral taxon HOT-345]|nr:hypothetical protein BSK20_05120 [SR1 bacterium human oral taxon HOT-345]RKW23207.1 MAG: hypothetical protein D8B45_03815 [Candidatus Gracilibacteria bacterium]